MIIYLAKALLIMVFYGKNGLKPNPSHALHIGLIIFNPFGILRMLLSIVHFIHSYYNSFYFVS